MFTDISKFTDKLVKYELTAEQYFILYLIENRDVNNLKKYINKNGLFDGKVVHQLIEKGYLLNTDPKSERFDLANLVVTFEFIESEAEILTDEEAWEQLLDEYPKFVEVNGTKYPSTGLNLQDSIQAEKLYKKEIEKNKVLHAEILVLLKRWKKDIGESAPFKIDKFITSKYWIELRNLDNNANKPRIY